KCAVYVATLSIPLLCLNVVVVSLMSDEAMQVEGAPLTDQAIWGDDEAAADMEHEIASKTTEQLESLTRMLENNIRVMNSELTRLSHEQKSMAAKIKDNYEKIKLNKQLP
ncbi:hypothetical protein BVRB_039440, partial [Beta vulgaris subsp. vulgaris]